MSKVKAVINDFERVIVLRELKEDFNLVNFVRYINIYGEVYYSFFFKRGGFIFAKRMLFSASLYSEDKLSIIEYIEQVRESLQNTIEKLDRTVLVNDSCPYDVVEFEARCLVSEIEYLTHNLFSIDEFYTLRDKVFANLNKECVKLISIGAKRTDVFSLLFRKYIMSFEELEELVLNLKYIGGEKDE